MNTTISNWTEEQMLRFVEEERGVSIRVGPPLSLFTGKASKQAQRSKRLANRGVKTSVLKPKAFSASGA